jgi:prevent-host-death family protein
MPTIRPSADLRNKYNEISEFCHEYSEPVFITKNGTGDLAVMSIETYELLTGKQEFYRCEFPTMPRQSVRNPPPQPPERGGLRALRSRGNN